MNWLLIMIIRNLITPLGDDWNYRILQTFITTAVFSASYYFFCLVISPYLKTKNWKKFTLLLLLYTIASMYLLFITSRIFGVIFENGIIPVQLNTSEFIYTFVYCCMIAMLSHSFYQKQISIQILNAQSEKEQICLMQETLFFKNQFNSHISLNFLSYCYANAINKDDETSKAIENYSEMMKYTLQTEASQKVPINKEIAYIEQFVQLQKQIGNDAEVKINKDEDLNQIFILPRILINYVENAFKYGITDDPEKPVTINLNRKEKFLYFSITNFKKKISVSQKSTGTGHRNSKMQLDLFYPNKYKIEVLDSKYEYTYRLQIKIE